MGSAKAKLPQTIRSLTARRPAPRRSSDDAHHVRGFFKSSLRQTVILSEALPKQNLPNTEHMLRGEMLQPKDGKY
jgi:hypothetical protein